MNEITVNGAIVSALSAKDRVYADELQAIDPNFLGQIRLLINSAGMNIRGFREEQTGRVFYMLLETVSEGTIPPTDQESDDDQDDEDRLTSPPDVPSIANPAAPRPTASPAESPSIPSAGVPDQAPPDAVEIYALDLKTKILSSGKTKVEFYAADADNADAVNRFLTRAGGAEAVIVRFRVVKSEGKTGEKSVPASSPTTPGNSITTGTPPTKSSVPEPPLAFDVRKGVAGIPGASRTGSAIPGVAEPLAGSLYSSDGDLIPGNIPEGAGPLPGIAGVVPTPRRIDPPMASGGAVSQPPAAELVPVTDASGKVLRYIERPNPAVPDAPPAEDVRERILQNPGLSPGSQAGMIGLLGGTSSGDGAVRRI